MNGKRGRVTKRKKKTEWNPRTEFDVISVGDGSVLWKDYGEPCISASRAGVSRRAMWRRSASRRRPLPAEAAVARTGTRSAETTAMIRIRAATHAAGPSGIVGMQVTTVGPRVVMVKPGPRLLN